MVADSMSMLRRFFMSRKNVFFVFVFLFLAASFSTYIYFFYTGQLKRLHTIVLLGNPTLVVSRAEGERIVTVVSLPQALLFDGVRGYGRYSLEALLRLGDIDRVGGQLVSGTLSESLAVPIDGYIGKKDESDKKSPSGERITTKISKFFCSVRCIYTFIRHREYLTDLSLASYIRFSFLFNGLSESDIKFIDVKEKNIVKQSEESDGLTVEVFDTKKFDAYMPNIFEERLLRKEALRVRVINATTTVGLGEKFARKLSRFGALPVAVESAEDRELKRCELIGTNSKQSLYSLTAKYIAEVYDCFINDRESPDTRVDLTVRVGAMYESRYLPLREALRQIPRR